MKFLLTSILVLGGSLHVAAKESLVPNVHVFFSCGGEEIDYTVLIGHKILGSKIVQRLGNLAPCVDEISGYVRPGDYLLTVKSKKLRASGKLGIKVSKGDTWITTSGSNDPKKIELRQESKAPRFE